MKQNTYQSIIITGASSGIGAALAAQFAQPGVTLGLCGRNSERLDNIAQECKSRGANVHTLLSDVKEKSKISVWMETIDEETPVDLVIANAGISAGTGQSTFPEPQSQIESVFEINTNCAIHNGQCLLSNMIKRQKGHIAFTGSMAGFQGWPGAPAYCASKSALHTYAEALRLLIKPHNVNVSVIAPGFVETAMTAQNDYAMPFMVSPENAAQIIIKGLHKNNRYIIFPKRMYWLTILAKVLPEFIVTRLSQNLPGKKKCYNKASLLQYIF